MQTGSKLGFYIIQLKSYVTQIFQSRPYPFRDGFLGNSWWGDFKKRHLELVLQTMEFLDRGRALNIRPTIVLRCYVTLSNAYRIHSYTLDHIWNYDETRLQDGRNYGIRVITMRGSKNVPKIMPKNR